MQEFLALNSDACTYFGRKPFVKSRIDKVGEDKLLALRRQITIAINIYLFILSR